MGLAATYGVNRIDGLRVRKKVNPKKSYCRMIFFNGFAIKHKLPDFFFHLIFILGFVIEHKLRGSFFIGVEECKRLLMNF